MKRKNKSVQRHTQNSIFENGRHAKQRSRTRRNSDLPCLFTLAFLAGLALVLIHFSSAFYSGLVLASVPLALTEDQIKEFQTILSEMKGGWAELRGLPTTCKGLQDENAQLKQQVTDVRRLMATRT